MLVEDRDAVAGGADRLRIRLHRCRQALAQRREREFLVARDSREALAVFEDEPRLEERAHGCPAVGGAPAVRVDPTIHQCTCRVRLHEGDAPLVCADLLEAGNGAVDVARVVEVGALHQAGGVALGHHEVRALERTTVPCADPAARREEPAARDAHVIGADPYVRRELGHRSNGAEEPFPAADGSPPHQTMVVADEVRRVQTRHGVPFAAVGCSPEVPRPGCHLPAFASAPALVQLGVG